MIVHFPPIQRRWAIQAVPSQYFWWRRTVDWSTPERAVEARRCVKLSVTSSTVTSPSDRLSRCVQYRCRPGQVGAAEVRGRRGGRVSLCAQLGRPFRQFDEGHDHFGDDPVLTRHEVLAEVADPAQGGGQLDLDAVCGGQVDGIAGVEAETDAFGPRVVVREALAEELAGRVHQGVVEAADDDPPERAGLTPAERRAVGLDHRCASWTDVEVEAVASEPVHGDGDLDVLEEGGHLLRLTRVVSPGREMDAQVRRLDDGVVRGPGLFGGPARDLVGAAVLGAAVQGHETDGRTELAHLLHAGQREELSQIHLRELYPFWRGRFGFA